MASVNLAILIGNLGSDPEVRYTPSGQAVANFNIATTEVWTDRDGQKQQRTEWHRIILWGRQAEIAKDYLKKGDPVYIQGRIQNRTYEDKNGVTRNISEVVGQRMQLLSRRRDAQGESAPAAAAAPDLAAPPGPEDDDLPF